MCGLVAVVPKYSRRGLLYPEATAFETLVTLDTLRGEDSTGIFSANNDELRIMKEAKTGSEILRSKEYQDMRAFAIKDARFIVAHNRKATRGTVNDTNAHPFWKDDKVVMVHNGTFVGDHKKHADTEVDSEALCHLLANHETTETDKVLGQINAAYAVIWYDVRDHSLNLIRNDQRPLYVWETQTAWLFSSEALMLHFTVLRANISVNKDSGPELLEEHEHYKFDFSESQTKLSRTKVKIPFRQQDEIADAWNRYNYGHRVHHTQRTTTQDAANNNNLACAWNNDGTPKNGSKHAENFKAITGHDLPDPAHNSMADKIISDAVTVPMLSIANFNSYRELYKDGSYVHFNAKNIIPVENDGYILYGSSELDDDVIIAAKINEDDFTKLITLKGNKQILRGKVKLAIFKNLITTCDPGELSGPVIIQLHDLEKARPTPTEEHCGC